MAPARRPGRTSRGPRRGDVFDPKAIHRQERFARGQNASSTSAGVNIGKASLWSAASMGLSIRFARRLRPKTFELPTRLHAVSPKFGHAQGRVRWGTCPAGARLGRSTSIQRSGGGSPAAMSAFFLPWTCARRSRRSSTRSGCLPCPFLKGRGPATVEQVADPTPFAGRFPTRSSNGPDMTIPNHSDVFSCSYPIGRHDLKRPVVGRSSEGMTVRGLLRTTGRGIPR